MKPTSHQIQNESSVAGSTLTEALEALKISGGTSVPSWDSITDKPSTFPPSTHTHTDKQDTLVSGTNIKTINGNSILGNGNLVVAGGGGLTLNIVTGTTQTATSGNEYALTNVSATTLTAPASASTGDKFAWDVCNGLTTNTINWNGLKHEGLSDSTMTLTGPYESGEAIYINATYGWKVK